MTDSQWSRWRFAILAVCVAVVAIAVLRVECVVRCDAARPRVLVEYRWLDSHCIQIGDWGDSIQARPAGYYVTGRATVEDRGDTVVVRWEKSGLMEVMR